MTAVLERDVVVADADAPAVLTVEADHKAIRAAFRNAALFCSKDELRPILTGTLVECVPATTGDAPVPAFVRLVSTDSHRLLVQEIPAEVSGAGSAIVSRTDLVTFAGVKPNTRDAFPAVLTITERASVAFSVLGGPAITGGRPIEGSFPNWEQLGQAAGPVTDPGAPAAFNPGFLADMGKLESLTGASRANSGNNALIVTLDPSPLKPARFDMTGQDNARLFGILMPIRTPATTGV